MTLGTSSASSWLAGTLRTVPTPDNDAGALW